MIDLERFWDGDRAYVGEILKAHEEFIWKAARRFGEDEDDACDLFQLAVLRIWDQRQTYTGNGSFEAWLYRVSANECRREVLRRNVERTHMDEMAAKGVLSEFQWSSTPTLSDIFSEEVWAKVEQALSNLPDRQHEAYELYVLQLRPTRDVAKVMGIGPSTVRSLVRKARVTLRSSLKELFDDMSGL